MKRKELQRVLRMIGACTPARIWVSRTQGAPAELWKKCLDVFWMLWLARDAGALDRWVTANLVCRELVPLALEYADFTNWPRLLRMMPKITNSKTAEKAAELCRQAYDSIGNKNGLIGTLSYARSACHYGEAAADATGNIEYDYGGYRNYENSYYTLRRVMDVADNAGISERTVGRRLSAVIRKYIPWATVEKGLRGILR